MALMRCPKCGKEISDKAKACPRCGSKFKEGDRRYPQKESRYKRKRKNSKSGLLIVLSVLLAFSLIGNIVQAVLYSKSKDTNKENNGKVKSEAAAGTTKNKEKQKDTLSNEKDASSEGQNVNGELKQLQLGETVEVHTVYGNFKLTADALRKCDWVERSGDLSGNTYGVLFEMDIQNIDYEDPYNEVFFLGQFLNIADDKNYVVQQWALGYEDGVYNIQPVIPRGANAKVVIPYQVNSDVKSLTININDEYSLSLEIAQ